jgi:predicted transcriptional regulator
MAKEDIDVLPVLSNENHNIIGILSYKNIISSYKLKLQDHQINQKAPISIKRNSLKLLVHGKKFSRYFKFGKS